MTVISIAALREKKKPLKPSNPLETLELLSLALLGCLENERKVAIAGVEHTSRSLVKSDQSVPTAQDAYQILLLIQSLLDNDSYQADLKKVIGPQAFKQYKTDIDDSVRSIKLIDRGQIVSATGRMVGTCGVLAGCAFEGTLWVLALMGVTLSTPVIFAPLGVLALAVVIGLTIYAIGKCIEARGKAKLKETHAPVDKLGSSDMTFGDAPSFFRHSHVKSKLSHFIRHSDKPLDLRKPGQEPSDFSLTTALP